jgi:hypothetical protein
MKLRAAIALVALAAPAFAQHGGGHAGSFGGRSSGSRSFGGVGSAGHAGFSGSPRFSQPGGFARPVQPGRFGAWGSAGFRGMSPTGFRTPYGGNRYEGNRLGAGGPRFNSLGAGQARTFDRNGDRNGNRSGGRERAASDARRRSFHDWYVSTYPAWPGYAWFGYGNPYWLDSGFYDWGDSDSSANDEGAAAAYSPLYPDDGFPYPDEGNGEQPAAAAPAEPNAPEQALTVIFKSGEAAVKVENYMMTATVLTDLDPQHYRQIPLDEIDLAATQRANSAAGVDFQVPGAARE